ncbi:unnamed protein product [Linum trigynum]|uniref:Uncharacterized protein n=1 Tax=Linum trigynum TaxID=586398 RepID=A0AAV2FTB8_9ROSI
MATRGSFLGEEPKATTFESTGGVSKKLLPWKIPSPSKSPTPFDPIFFRRIPRVHRTPHSGNPISEPRIPLRSFTRPRRTPNQFHPKPPKLNNPWRLHNRKNQNETYPSRADLVVEVFSRSHEPDDFFPGLSKHQQGFLCFCFFNNDFHLQNPSPILIGVFPRIHMYLPKFKPGR